MTTSTPITSPIARSSTRRAAEDDKPMTLSQTAAYLRMSRAHLSNILHRRLAGLPPLRHAAAGRRILVKPSWADQWLEELAARSVEKW